MCGTPGVDETFRVGPPGLGAVHIPYVSVGSRMLRLFGRPMERQSAYECIRSSETTLPQAMHLLNSQEFLFNH